MRFKTVIPFIFFSLTAHFATAQSNWNLKTVVDYAMANNLNVKLSDVQANISALILKQSQYSRIPGFDLALNTAVNSGSNQDPTSFSRITNTYLSSGLQLQGSANIFNFFSLRNTIAGNEWEALAAKANVDKIKNDIALTVANAYLQILLAKEQQNIAKLQLDQTQAQLNNTRKFVKEGALPELNAAQLEAQLAADSGNYITAGGNLTVSILTLKAFMNIDAAAPFEVETPPVESIPVDPIGELQPEEVFKMAIANQPLQKYNDLRLKAAEKFKAAARASQYPSISLFGSLGSGSRSGVEYIRDFSYNPSVDTVGSVIIGGVPYNVTNPNIALNPVLAKRSFPNQFSDNFRQSLGISISIPIFSGYSLRTQYERSKLNIKSLQLQKDLDNQKLKQDIYQAYTSAFTALEKYNASRKAVEINEKTLMFAQKRFDVGLLNTFDLLTTQNNLLRSRLEYAINQFDYVFKMKVLEFYKGNGIKL